MSNGLNGEEKFRLFICLHLSDLKEILKKAEVQNKNIKSLYIKKYFDT